MTDGERRAIARALRSLGWSRGRVAVAQRFSDRLLGMTVRAPVGEDGKPAVLVIPRCRSVHTWGMRYPIDIAFIDADGEVLEVHRGVSPRSSRRCCRAAAVIERASVERGDVRTSRRVQDIVEGGCAGSFQMRA